MNFVLTSESHEYSKLGFEEITNKKSGNFAESIIASVINGDNFEVIIKLRIYCQYANAIYPLYLRPGSDVNWEIVDGVKKNERNGSAQMKNEGFVQINLNSPKSLRGMKMNVNINGYTNEITLGSGPYILNIPENACRKI